MKKTRWVASILIPLIAAVSGAGIGFVVGWVSNEYHTTKKLEETLGNVREINDSQRAMIHSIERMYLDPNLGNASGLEQAARESFTILYLNKDSIGKTTAAEQLTQFIELTIRGLEALDLLDSNEEYKYVFANNLERYKSLATLVKDGAKYSELFSLKNESDMALTNRVRSEGLDVEKQAYDFRQSVGSYTDVDSNYVDLVSSFLFNANTLSDSNN